MSGIMHAVHAFLDPVMRRQLLNLMSRTSRVRLFTMCVMLWSETASIQLGLPGLFVAKNRCRSLMSHLARYAALGGKPGDLPVAERAAHEVLSLPLYPTMAADQYRPCCGWGRGSAARLDGRRHATLIGPVIPCIRTV
jgi:hypothetical protein